MVCTRLAPCRCKVCFKLETSAVTDSNNRSNTQETMTYAADYTLGGGVTGWTSLL